MGSSGTGGWQRWPARLFWIGLLIVAVGAAGDVLYHSLPANLANDLDLLLGADGGRAHLVTLVGMVLTVVGLSAHTTQRHPWRGDEFDS
ncbi:MAG TPA: hypothetical protein VEX37_13995 [Thermomicrobiales bacterium]|nr:hypothetical protein [Thermomicrobiales bacterium]